MCELLILAFDTHNPDALLDCQAYKAGHVIAVKPDGHPWGSKETLPKFVIVKVPDALITDAEHLLVPWVRRIDWAVVAQNPSMDGFRLNIFSTNLSVTDQGVGAGKLTRAMVEAYLNNWGASVVSIADNSVIFDVTIYDALISPGFWRFPLAGVIFSELSYVQSTGVHTIQADYSANIDWKPGAVGAAIASRGGTVISNAAGVVRFTMTRQQASDAFKQDLKEKLENHLYIRRFYAPSALVQSIVSQGGILNTTKAALLAAVHDRLLE